MSSHCSIHFLSSVPVPSTKPSFSPTSSSNLSLLPSPGVLLFKAKNKSLRFDIRPKCSAVSQTTSNGYADVIKHNGLPVIKWHEIVEDELEEEEEATHKVTISKEINKHVETIKSMLGSMDDGEISISAYDTAWVALVEDVNGGSGSPQFPSSLKWIADNQLPDGSWGDHDIFEAHDRIINTLACVIALKSWKIHPEKCAKGMQFFKENLCKLENENPEHMPIGFEVAFPSLLEIAKKLDIEIPHSPILQEIDARRNLKLTRIPKDIMHNVPTTLLHSLEGMEGLDWEKLQKLQCKDGSFLFSPSSTAYALMNTKDNNSLNYIHNMVQKFKGGVPNVYPVDLFEHIWAVDRLQRLGISRYFEPEIKDCVDYIHRYWDEVGICWARNSEVHDIDDTAMGFRILRLQGHDVSADVFKNFKKGDDFFCFAGQSSQAVTGMFNLYRASQVMFPGENILEEAQKYASRFLREKQAANEVADKWIITKDLPGEVGYALDVPWNASLPRVETRFYIEQYGGEDDVWIGKTLYRMPYVNNNVYLNLAKIDYNNCQDMHRSEWDHFQKWYYQSNLSEYGVSKRSLLLSYFVAAATIFEPEKSRERIAWAKTSVLLEAIESYFRQTNSVDHRKAFVHEFKNGIGHGYPVNGRRLDAKKTRQDLVRMLLTTLYHISLDVLVTEGRDISHCLRQSWENWMLKWEQEGDRRQGEAELLVQTITLTAGYSVSEQTLTQNQLFEQLSDLINRLCVQLGRYKEQKVHENGSYNEDSSSVKATTPEIESEMKQLTELVLKGSTEDAMEVNIKQTYLSVAKSLYYTAFCDPGTINHHIARVLFERVY